VSRPLPLSRHGSSSFFEPLGWREVIFRSTLDDAIRLLRAPPAAEWWSVFAAAWWPDSRRSLPRVSGVLLVEAARMSARLTASDKSRRVRP
jgi:hypothetical protein